MNKQTTILKKIQEIAKKTEMGTKEFGPLSGKIGIALWYYYLSRYVDEAYHEIAEKWLMDVLSDLHNNSITFTHCGGYSGICWTLLHLKEHGYIDMDTDILDHTDERLFIDMETSLHNNNWDFLHGASGIILYFLKKRQNTSDTKNIDRYIDVFIKQMSDMAVNEQDDCMKWASTVYTDDKSRMVYNICLSHGMSALLTIFTKIYLSYNKSNDLFRRLIEETSQYIIHQRIDPNIYKSCFPSYSIESEPHLVGSRLGWCYGDLGIAMALWQAGVALNEQKWQQIAVETMKHAATRKVESSTMDAGICHGTAGIAHIFNRMHQYTKIEQFKTSSDYWIDETLKMAKFDDGVAGYKTYRAISSENYINDYTLLSGVSGIGLCLLSNIYDGASAWDECLLLS